MSGRSRLRLDRLHELAASPRSARRDEAAVDGPPLDRRGAPRRRADPVDTRTRGAPQEVRLIGGVWKRSKLPVADAPGLRPTPDRVRETLYNWLGQQLDGWRCLDAFAGSGALGFEAASRGAAAVTLLERDKRLADSLERSKARLGATQIRIESVDALAWMARAAPASFELVLLDPPFDAPLLAPALALARTLAVPGGYVYTEAAREVAPPEGLEAHRGGRAGAVRFQLFRRIAEA